MSLTSAIYSMFSPEVKLPDGIKITYTKGAEPQNAATVKKHIISQLAVTDIKNQSIPDLDPAIFDFNRWHIMLDTTSLNSLIQTQCDATDKLIKELPEDTDEKKYLKQQLQAIMHDNKVLMLQKMYLNYFSAATVSAKQAILDESTHITELPECKIVNTQLKELVEACKKLAGANAGNLDTCANDVATKLDALKSAADATYGADDPNKQLSAAATAIYKTLNILAWVAIPVVIYGLTGAIVGAIGAAAAAGVASAASTACSCAAATGNTATILGVCVAALKTAAILRGKTAAGFGLLNGLHSFWDNDCKTPTAEQLKKKLHSELGDSVMGAFKNFAMGSS